MRIMKIKISRKSIRTWRMDICDSIVYYAIISDSPVPEQH